MVTPLEEELQHREHNPPSVYYIATIALMIVVGIPLVTLIWLRDHPYVMCFLWVMAIGAIFVLIGNQ